MKKVLILLLSIFTIISTKAQFNNIDYPQYVVKNGDTIGVMITVSQAQKIDSDYDLSDCTLAFFNRSNKS
jgi:hypothetical protein